MWRMRSDTRLFRFAPLWGLCVALLSLSGCAPLPTAGVADGPAPTAQARYEWLNRITWGANTSTARVVEQQGSARWLQQQLQPQGASLP
jgi:hypothetical protein